MMDMENPEIEAEEIDAEAPETEQERPEDAAARQEAEAEARKYGWRPKAEFDRDPDGWVDASRFLELPSTNVKMLRDAKRELQQQLEAERKDRAEAFARIEATQAAVANRIREQERVKFEAEREQLLRAKREAAASHDLDRYDQLSRKEALMKPPQDIVSAQVSQEPQRYPEVEDYRAKNEWAQDPALWNEAYQAVNAAIQFGKPFSSAQEQLVYAEGVMRRKYPHMFQAAPAAAISRVDGGGLATGRRVGRGADDLPPEAKKVAAEYVKEGIYKSMAEYAADYFAQGAN
jgi:hypothetical protein